MKVYRFEAVGDPVPQGSTRAFMVGGRPIVTHTKGVKLNEWREVIGWAARDAVKEVHEGPMTVEAVFWFLRPPSVSVKKRPHMTVKPDIDKVSRSLLDALTGIVFRDDCQVVKLDVAKRYCNEDVKQPGVTVTVRVTTEGEVEG
jgi:Holliday junction resolvase RusA-like endonuclease